MTSAIVVPLTARGRTLGAMTLATDRSRRSFDADDLALAEELARRCALAVDNARLYGERSHVARTLQGSLVPAQIPPVPGFEVAARFHAAGEDVQVGGDFFDVFETDDGSWAAVVGDVSGKGADAAAITALARYTVRAVAVPRTPPEHRAARAQRRGAAPRPRRPLLHRRVRPPARWAERLARPALERRPPAARPRHRGGRRPLGRQARHGARDRQRPAADRS